MKDMKRFFAAIVALMLSVLFCCVSSYAQSPQETYIDTYSEIAVQEMYRSGVPASITLAQGMLESGNGRSQLAVKANNHFGIKCHNGWTGGRVYHDDDAKGECFRKYSHVRESFRDHSDFLRYRDRYKFLFDLNPTDYKGWAYGLKKAGYATDPSYPSKLIKLIEDYRLYQYDTKTASFGNAGKSVGKKKGTEFRTGQTVETRPVSPTVIEQVQPATRQAQKKYFQFTTSREMFSKNGVPFVYAHEGETLQSIAKKYNLFVRELMRYNDLDLERPLEAGEVVYLQAKKNCAVKGLDMHVLEGGETLWGISQRYAVKLEKIYKLNGWQTGFKPKEGDAVRLRKR